MKLRTDLFTKTIFFVIVCLLTLPLSAQDVVKDLRNFREVKTFNGVEVIVIPSEANRIEITGHSKEKVKFEIIEDRLEIRLTLDNIWSDDNTLITVYGKSIETIDANEGSLVKTDGKLVARMIMLRAQEGASIFAEAEAETVRLKAVSGGNITVKGKAENQEAEANTGGQFYGKDLKTEETTVSVGTAGKAEVYAKAYCKATASLGGVVKIFGNPDAIDRKTSLGGKIL
jgi:hypothetical protein